MPVVLPGPRRAGRSDAGDVVSALEIVPSFRRTLQLHDLDVPGLPEHGPDLAEKATLSSWESLSLSHQQIPEQAADPAEEQRELLYRAIATLSPLNKAIVLLHFDELSYDEIAGITGLTKSNVSVRLVRIKKELETQLKKQTDLSDNVNA